MKLQITARNCKLAKKDLDYIKKKLQGLEKLHMKLDKVFLIIKEEKLVYEMELMLKAMHKDFVMKKKSKNIQELINTIVDKMLLQMSKLKEKVKDHSHPKALEIVAETEAVPQYTLEYKNHTSLEKLSHFEAADKLLALNNEVFLYIDINTNKLAAALKKNNNTIEIIEV